MMTANVKHKPRFQDTPLVVQVYEWLRDAIYKGEYAIDDKLNIDQLSQEWGISKTPIREALSALCKDGLVAYAPRQGFFVKRLTYKELMDALELREALELYCLERYFNAYDRAALMEYLARFESAYRRLRTTGSSDTYLNVDADFHTFLVESTGNQKIIETYQVIDANLRYLRLQDTNFLNELAGATITEHTLIINAILSDDAALATSELVKHLRNVGERFTRQHAGEEDAAGESKPRY